MTTYFQTINIHGKREARRGVVNNQILDWSFKLDGFFHNASQEHVYGSVASDIVSSALEGYNGKFVCLQCLPSISSLSFYKGWFDSIFFILLSNAKPS